MSTSTTAAARCRCGSRWSSRAEAEHGRVSAHTAGGMQLHAMRRAFRSLAAAALIAGLLAAPAHASVGPAHTIGYDRYSFSVDGQRVWLWSAEFHYFRLPNPDLWRDQLEKLKAAGFNPVSPYFS